MYKINQELKNQTYEKLQVQQLAKSEAFEVLAISLEKDALFPEHTSPTNALLVVIEGAIDFHISNESLHLKEQEYFSFAKQTPHWVRAEKNSKFLIIR